MKMITMMIDSLKIKKELKMQSMYFKEGEILELERESRDYIKKIIFKPRSLSRPLSRSF